MVYGRRRVGKTYLVREVFANRILFMHTGRANAAMKQQLAAFRASLQEQGLANCPPLGSWLEAFQELKRLISLEDLDEAADQMMRDALENGGRDNITLVIAEDRRETEAENE